MGSKWAKLDLRKPIMENLVNNHDNKWKHDKHVFQNLGSKIIRMVSCTNFYKIHNLGRIWSNLIDHLIQKGRWVVTTSHMRLKARDHDILRSLVGWKVAALQIHFTLEGEGQRAWEKSSWMKSLHGLQHDILEIIFLGMLEFALGPPPRGRFHTNSGRPWPWYEL